jgi:hypothetical protein
MMPDWRNGVAKRQYLKKTLKSEKRQQEKTKQKQKKTKKNCLKQTKNTTQKHVFTSLHT